MTKKRTRRITSRVDVLITGAAGFIGAKLMQRLKAQGLQVLGADVRAREDSVIAMDITSRDQVETAFKKHKPKRVVHLAAIVDDRGDPRLFTAVNVDGTRNVLNAAITGPLERFVQVSSIVALGFDPGLNAGADSPLVTTTGSPYFDTKALSEQIVRSAQAEQGIPAVIIRPGDVYGPGSEPWVTRPIDMMRKRLPVLVDGGRGLMAHCWIDNLVDALVLAVTHPDAEGHIFQVHDGCDHTTYKRYFSQLARVANAPKPKLSLPYQPALLLGKIFDEVAKRTSIQPPFSEAAVRFLSRRATYSMENTRRILGYTPAVGLDEGLAKLAPAL